MLVDENRAQLRERTGGGRLLRAETRRHLQTQGQGGLRLRRLHLVLRCKSAIQRNGLDERNGLVRLDERNWAGWEKWAS